MKNKDLIIERIEKLKKECLEQNVVPQIMIGVKDNKNGYMSSFYTELKPLKEMLRDAHEQVNGAE